MKTYRSNPNTRLAGYAELIDRYELNVIPNWHRSAVAVTSTHRVDTTNDVTEEIFPARYWPGDTLGDHLEFALKYDGTNLALLSQIFEAVQEEEFLRYVRSRPTGKYARRLWFFYEFLTNRTLPLDDLTQGNYVDLLNPRKYYTTRLGHAVRRQRVRNNLMGDSRFCPTVRRTETMRNFEKMDLAGRCRKIVSAYPQDLIKRALNYLYNRETKSSFEIEHIKTSASRTERFVTLLQTAEQKDFCNKEQLIDLQNRIVDPRFRDVDYRTTQNYVGETVAWEHEHIHFVSPKPEDLKGLMDGLIDAHVQMQEGDIPAVIHAAVIGYGFVFLHPFEDGNGRIHRFLFHNILARQKFTPSGIMFPLSAVMLKNRTDYDESLEAFSLKLMSLIDYSLDPDGRMAVHNETATWYRYMDMTAQTEALYRFIEQIVETELAWELGFLSSYDQAKTAMQNIVDMPDQKLDLFIRLCLQNNGKLSAVKRERQFSTLTDSEISSLETAVRSAYRQVLT